MLYPDNESHRKAVEVINSMENGLSIQHVEKKDEEGNIINKSHFHCVIRFSSPYWLSKLLSDLGLSDSDSHLFKSYKDFKIKNKSQFRSIEDYISYLDHVLNDDKPDKYSIDDFKGGLKSLAAQIINSRELENYQSFLTLCEWIREYNLDNFTETRFFGFKDWFRVCSDHGYGKIFYKEWYKLRDVLKDYINY